MDSQRNPMNPLLHEVVIQVLFSHLDNSTLKTIRFVHTSWAKEAFNLLRKSSLVKLDNCDKLKKFLNSGFNHRFFGFGFQIQDCDWSQDLFSFLIEAEPRFIDVYFLLTLAAENLDSFNQFSSIIKQYCNKIRILCLDICCTEMCSNQPSIEKSLLEIQYPNLKCLLIRNQNITQPESLIPLLIEILKSSPNLTELESNIQNIEFWKNIRKIQNIKHLDTLTVPKITSEIINTCVDIPNLTLKKLSIQFEPTEVSVVLSRFASSLEYLGFFTPKESALSPIDFPVMPHLKSLNAGQSQLSFPSILSEKLPVLEKLSATYWDWVFTFEVLPDIHYYWRTSQPHESITSFDITFPERTEISGDYVAMENFVDFGNRIVTKFPNLTNIRLTNVFIKVGHESCIGAITEAFGHQLKELSIMTYSPISDCDSTGLFSSISNCINLEILDLNPSCWSCLWKKKNVSKSFHFDEFNATVTPLTKLRVLKIPYVKDLSIENLFGNECENFPELTVLGIQGNRCVNRFDKAKLKRCRPNIKIVQYDCFCSQEDSWFTQDTKSHSIFNKLFESQ